MSPRLWLLAILALAGALAPSRADAHGVETCAQGFFATATTERPQSESQVAGTHQGSVVCGYESASGYSQAAEEGGTLQSQVLQQQMSGSGSNADIADAIANGHAFDKHVIGEGMNGDIGQSEFADHIQAVLDNPTMSQSLSAGTSAFYDEASGTVVIVNPAAADYGTAFVPKNPLQYFQGLK